MSNVSVVISVTPRQRAVLEPLARARLTPQRLVERCRIVLLSAEGRDNEDQARELRVDRQRVRRWRHRWAKASAALAAAEAEGASDKDLERLILGILADDERSGAPSTFTPEQLAAIIALACEPPADSGLPVSHWTPPELAREAIKRGIVQTISRGRRADDRQPRAASGRPSAAGGERTSVSRGR